jgi:transketolase
MTYRLLFSYLSSFGYHFSVSSISNNRLSRLKEIRKRILQASFNAQDGHIPSAFSILEILYAFYVELPRQTDMVLDKDFEIILSKGHASMALYGILEEIGSIDSRWIDSFAQFESDFGGHPDSLKIPQIILSSGSLGHGLPFAIGRVLANRMNGIDKRVFVIVGDGELNEGSNWEAMILAEAHNLFELTLIVDQNNSTDRSLPIKNISSKLGQFGFRVIEVAGHDVEEICQATIHGVLDSPIAIIAKTIKGYGIREMENNHAWHHVFPDQIQLENFNRELS